MGVNSVCHCSGSLRHSKGLDLRGPQFLYLQNGSKLYLISRELPEALSKACYCSFLSCAWYTVIAQSTGAIGIGDTWAMGTDYRQVSKLRGGRAGGPCQFSIFLTA